MKVQLRCVYQSKRTGDYYMTTHWLGSGSVVIVCLNLIKSSNLEVAKVARLKTFNKQFREVVR